MCIRTTKALGAGRYLDAARIVGEAADIVDDPRAGREGCLHHRGLAGVDRDDDTLAGQGLHDGDHPSQLLLERHRSGTRTGGFPTYVDDVGTFLRESEPVRDRPLSDRHGRHRR